MARSGASLLSALTTLPTSIRFQVTGEHIRKGKRGDPQRCPFALALRSLGYQYVWVKQWLVHIGKKAYELSPEARRLPARFDAGHMMLPGEYSMTEIPSWDMSEEALQPAITNGDKEGI